MLFKKQTKQYNIRIMSIILYLRIKTTVSTSIRDVYSLITKQNMLVGLNTLSNVKNVKCLMFVIMYMHLATPS